MPSAVGKSGTLRALRTAGLSPRLLSPLSRGYVYQLPALLSPRDADSLFDFLVARFNGWRTETDHFGRQQRATAYFGDDGTIFSYVGLTLRPSRWPDALEAARARANLVAAAHGTQHFSACLANHYTENACSIPWHSDEVRAHGDSRLVLALSLGGERRMTLRPRHGSTSQPAVQPMSLRLPAGSAVAMAGDAQEFWEHALPLDPGAAPRRVSLTFRTIVPGYEEGRPPPIPG